MRQRDAAEPSFPCCPETHPCPKAVSRALDMRKQSDRPRRRRPARPPDPTQVGTRAEKPSWLLSRSRALPASQVADDLAVRAAGKGLQFVFYVLQLAALARPSPAG